jgi:hypothetical protein
VAASVTVVAAAAMVAVTVVATATFTVLTTATASTVELMAGRGTAVTAAFVPADPVELFAGRRWTVVAALEAPTSVELLAGRRLLRRTLAVAFVSTAGGVMLGRAVLVMARAAVAAMAASGKGHHGPAADHEKAGGYQGACHTRLHEWSFPLSGPPTRLGDRPGLDCIELESAHLRPVLCQAATQLFELVGKGEVVLLVHFAFPVLLGPYTNGGTDS